MGYIYEVTNKINNKKYVGLTTLTPKERWKTHLKTANNPSSKDYNAPFKRAIRKYGSENFSIKAIDESDNLEELKEKEIYWIKTLNTCLYEEGSWGYNATKGGDFGAEISKKKIVAFDIVSGKKVKEYDSLREGQEAIGVRIEKVGVKNHSSGGYCFLFKDEIENMSEEELVDLVHSLYPCLVYQMSENGDIIAIHRDTSSAAKAVNGSVGNIVSCCLGDRRLSKGYQWCYQRDYEKRIGKEIRAKDTTAKRVIQYKLNGQKVQEWESITAAANSLGCQDSHIASCCKGKRTTAGGFQWRYAEENLSKVPEIFTKRKVQCIETGEIFETPNHAAKKFGYKQETVKNCCIKGTTRKPYHFKWYDE
jgi:group I intron endonuclease